MSEGLLSWGRHPPLPQTPTACHWRQALPRQFAETARRHGTTLAFGNGRSYGDACLAASDHVIGMRTLDRFIAADWETGILSAEAGVTFGQILSACIPRGWFLPVTPGTQHLTLGGAIANDVHGKNHHRRGTFGPHVRRLGLLRSDRGRLECGPNQEADLFAATVGGLGLTGLIEWAEIQLLPIRSSRIRCTTQRFNRLEDFFELSAALDAQHEFAVAWIDCAARGTQLGRGVYSVGDFVESGPLEYHEPGRLAVPVTPPMALVNRASLRGFNSLYWRRAPGRVVTRELDYLPFLYPLDGIADWNRLYGPSGFQQYQCVLPEASARSALTELLAAIADSGTGSFLAVLKRCGDVPSPGWLSFPLPGTSLALDFPQSSRLDETLFPRLDAIVRAAGGRLYPAKDAHVSGEDFRAAYPQWRRLEELRDPALLSRFWQRVMA